MYHDRFRKSHYEAGYNWGSRLYGKGISIDQNFTLERLEERKIFAKDCLPVYEKHYPEILEEIRGVADGQKSRYEYFYTFLFSMYCFNGNTTAFIEMEDGINEYGLAVGLTLSYYWKVISWHIQYLRKRRAGCRSI